MKKQPTPSRVIKSARRADKIEAPLPAPKKSSFWEDDEDELYGDDLKKAVPAKADVKATKTPESVEVPQKAEKSSKTTQSSSKTPPAVPTPMPESTNEAPEVTAKPEVKQVPPPPADMLNIHAGATRVLIMDALDSSWAELLCYNYDLRCTMHLRRADLAPRDVVSAVCDYLRTSTR